MFEEFDPSMNKQGVSWISMPQKLGMQVISINRNKGSIIQDLATIIDANALGKVEAEVGIQRFELILIKWVQLNDEMKQIEENCTDKFTSRK